MTLDPKTIEQLKTQLLSEKERLEKELEQFAKPTDTPGNYKTQFQEIGSDRDENASEVEQYSDDLALENSLETQLGEINQALEKMEKNTYGICENCHKEMDIERLMAYPAAKSCVMCKE